MRTPSLTINAEQHTRLLEIDHEEKQIHLEPASAPNSALSTAMQIGAGAVGSLSIVLYISPSEACALKEVCGKWLSDATSTEISRWIFFSAGGLDFALTNIYFAFYSLPQLTAYIASQPTMCAKIGKSLLLSLFTITQMANEFLVAKGTGSGPLQLAFSSTGAGPAAIFTGVKFATQDIPYLTSKVQSSLLEFKEGRGATLIPEEIEFLDYQKKQTVFLTHVRANRSKLMTQVSSLNMTEQAELIPFLFEQKAIPEEESKWIGRARFVAGSSGLVLISCFFRPVILNAYDMLAQYPEYIGQSPILKATLAGALGLKAIYSGTRLVWHSFTSSYDALKNILTGRSVEWMAWQLHPNLTVITGLMGLIIAALSYATVSSLFENTYNGVEENREMYRAGALVAIDLYHWICFLHLYDLLLSRLTSNPKENFLLQLESEIKRLEIMPVNQFKEYYQHLPTGIKSLVNGKQEEKQNDDQETHINIEPTKKTPQSWSHYFGSFFRREHESPASQSKQQEAKRPLLSFGIK